MRSKMTVTAALGVLCLVFAMPSVLFGAGTPLADNYAIVFSGGISAGSNHDRYYEETLAMWQFLTGPSGGFEVDNVYVLFGDGTDPAVDRSTDVSSDWSAITAAGGHIDSGTPGHLQDTFTLLDGLMDEHDYFYFWSFDHGGNPTYDDDTDPVTPGTLDLGYLCGWGGNITDDTFATWAAPLDVKHETYAFGQCFAGDMANDLNLTAGDSRFAAWAADFYEPSWGKTWAVAWLDGLESGLFTTHDLGQYAVDHDASVPSEHPGWTGDNFAYRSGFEDQYSFRTTFYTGDFYEGSLYAASDHGYFVGYYETFLDENGHIGYYDIIDADYTGIDASLYGEITVDWYHDGESGQDYYRSSGDIFGGTGGDYLGSESGHIINASVDDFFFGNQGGVIQEADLAVQYSFTHYYDDGCKDYYSGTVYGPQGYYGTSLATTTENGLGHYDISVAAYLEDVSQYGQVTTTSYHDGESGNDYTLADVKIIGGTGGDYLGSEKGYIIMDGIPEYFFGAETPGGTIYEADLVAYRYDFTFTYSNGDSFSGVVYAEPEKAANLTSVNPMTVEQGQSGNYALTSGGTPGFDVAMAGQVVVDTYHDSDLESGRTYTGDKLFGGTGDNYLGSESGHIINPSVDDFFFGYKAGDPLFYEADLAVKYGFVHHYANNDWYRGIVYAPQGYYGETLDTTTEISAGYYALTVLEYLEDVSQYGQVYVDQYYDAEMKRIYLPTFFWGSNYLGSEYGYINIGGYPKKYHPADDFPPGIHKFFFGHWDGMMYEADVKKDKKS